MAEHRGEMIDYRGEMIDCRHEARREIETLVGDRQVDRMTEDRDREAQMIHIQGGVRDNTQMIGR